MHEIALRIGLLGLDAAGMWRRWGRGAAGWGTSGGCFAIGLDQRVRTVLAGAAPVDFCRAEPASRYGSQYTCQFITGKTETASRIRMLASSPLHFRLQANVAKVELFHGSDDTIVPLWNATEMATALQA